ncbi:hypothetical protein L1987_54404 [Smallanthus sonchifolius]|uniref:Uncharacterized protein n=1 Tax=Smallanthus sonchifolius TaxID=185202 RepID=A0ACB9E843_9ASTR|nr:hypothetical protein L1987_54404 [Smallanthus sonchifolius]
MRWTQKFDLDAIRRHALQTKLRGGLDAVIQKRYKDRKNDAKEWFLKVGGYDDLERAKANPPKNMKAENWKKSIDFFLSDAHIKRSAVNKTVRQKQKYTNRGGTSTYSSACYKQNKTRLEAFHDAHTLKDGTFDNELAEQQYVSIYFKYII